MSQNGPYSGPPWSSGGNSDEPYREPADPWGEHAAGLPDAPPAWGAHPPSIPQQPVSYHSGPMSPPVPPMASGNAVWGQPPPPKRSSSMLALVVTLGVLIVIGLGATAWLLKERNDNTAGATAAATSATAEPGAPAPLGSEDARFFVKEGDCVVNEGSDAKPEMRTTVCTTGTYQVLKRVKGKSNGEKDAETKCAKVAGYTKWFFYDSPLDDLDFVLCLKDYRDNQ
jgi:hypothetical protein